MGTATVLYDPPVPDFLLLDSIEPRLDLSSDLLWKVPNNLGMEKRRNRWKKELVKAGSISYIIKSCCETYTESFMTLVYEETRASVELMHTDGVNLEPIGQQGSGLKFRFSEIAFHCVSVLHGSFRL